MCSRIMSGSQTPKNKSADASRLSGSFSPVTVTVSPASRIKQHGNLTGIPRNIRDSIADLYNFIQCWNKEHVDGCLFITKIEGLLKKNSYMKDKILEELQSYCDLLEKCCENMDDIVAKMNEIEKSFKALTKLSEFQNTGKSTDPIFLTWPLSRFEKFANDIATAYNYEIKTKRLVLQRVALSENDTELTFFIATWTHQPFVTTAKLDLKIEAALLETNLK